MKKNQRYSIKIKYWVWEKIRGDFLVKLKCFS